MLLSVTIRHDPNGQFSQQSEELQPCERACQLRRNLSSRDHGKTQVIRTLKFIAALAAAALLIGLVGAAHRIAIEPKTKGLSMSLNVEPRQVLMRACEDCHSNHTDWPWYSHVPLVSSWIAQHVREGRERFNFSEWDNYSQWQGQDKLESICGLISTGRMPPWQYITMHPEARLTEKDKNAVCAWVKEATAERQPARLESTQ